MFIKNLEAIVVKCLDYDSTLGIDWVEEKAFGYEACMDQVEESICSTTVNKSFRIMHQCFCFPLLLSFSLTHA